MRVFKTIAIADDSLGSKISNRNKFLKDIDRMIFLSLNFYNLKLVAFKT